MSPAKTVLSARAFDYADQFNAEVVNSSTGWRTVRYTCKRCPSDRGALTKVEARNHAHRDRFPGSSVLTAQDFVSTASNVVPRANSPQPRDLDSTSEGSASEVDSSLRRGCRRIVSKPWLHEPALVVGSSSPAPELRSYFVPSRVKYVVVPS